MKPDTTARVEEVKFYLSEKKRDSLERETKPLETQPRDMCMSLAGCLQGASGCKLVAVKALSNLSVSNPKSCCPLGKVGTTDFHPDLIGVHKPARSCRMEPVWPASRTRLPHC